MSKLIAILSSLLGALGAFLCLVAGIVRLTGHFYLADVEALTVFNAGIGIMVFSILVKLECLIRARQ